MTAKEFDKLSEHDALMTDLTAEQLRKIYLPKNFELETFKPKELMFLEMAFERGAILAHNRENYKRTQQIQSLQSLVEEKEKTIKWLRKFIWEDSVNLNLENAVPPFRVGKRQKRTILDSQGHEIGIFVTGQEKIAQMFCDYLNVNPNLLTSEQKVKEEVKGEAERLCGCKADEFCVKCRTDM